MRNLWLLFVVGLATGFISDKLLVSSQSLIPTADDLYLEGHTSGDLPIDDEDGEDGGSGSGSGDYEELLRSVLNFSRTAVSREMVPVQPQSTADSHNPPTTAAASQDQTTIVRTTPYTVPGDMDGDGDKEVPGFIADWSTSSTSPPSETTTTEFSTDISISKDDSIDDSGLDRWDSSTPKDGRKTNLIVKEVADTNEMATPEEVTSENLWERTEVLAAVIACGVIGFLCAVFLLLLLAYRMKKKDEGSYDLGDTKLSTTAYHKAPTKEFYA